MRRSFRLGYMQRIHLRALFLDDWDGRTTLVNRRKRSSEVRVLETLRRWGLAEIVREEADPRDRAYRITSEGRLLGCRPYPLQPLVAEVLQ
jgi:hypothetical protein